MSERKRLAAVCSPLFLFLTSFRRNARRADFEQEWVHQQLVHLIDQIERDVTSDVELQRLFVKAKYPLVALADSIALDADWLGAESWELVLLEQHYFGTSAAGQEFYNRLKELGPEEDQLAEIYFLCLSLGFKGKLRNRPEERIELQQQLYARLPQHIAKKSENLCPVAYESTVERDMTKLPVVNFLRACVILLGLLFLSLIAGQLMWETNVESLDETSEHIIEWKDPQLLEREGDSSEGGGK